MANINITSDAWTEISITSGTVQNISATADIELSAEQTDNSGVVLKPSELYQWDNETIYARAVTEDTGALRVVNFKKAAGGGGYVLPVASSSTLGGVKVGSNLSIDASGVLSAENNYSTTEQKIGTWIDGKPLYQITIVDTMPTQDGFSMIRDVTSLNMRKVINISGIVALSDTKAASVNTTFTDIDYCNVYVTGISLNNLNAGITSQYISKPCYITLQYTKTTD